MHTSALDMKPVMQITKTKAFSRAYVLTSFRSVFRLVGDVYTVHVACGGEGGGSDSWVRIKRLRNHNYAVFRNSARGGGGGGGGPA